ncbi:MAG: T9SS type A sorting domain-containing protein [Bacteroidales bacterium]|jgi:hypothetical protein|nr:T9SS type A sorting domain-containing protein [Bacteroidales bacterium]
MKKRITTILIFILLFIAGILQSQEMDWQYAHAFGGSYGSDLSPFNKAYNLITDDYGNAYVFGTYGPHTSFNDSTLKFFSDGTRGSFIVKYNCSGGVDWFKAISNAEQYSDQGSHMILKNGYLYLMGTTHIDSYYKTWFMDTTIYGSQLSRPYTYPWQPTSYTYIIKMDTQEGSIVDYHLLHLERTSLSKNNSLWMDWTEKRAFMIDNEGNYYVPARFSTQYSNILYCDNVAIIDPVELDIIGESDTYIPYLLKFDSDFNFLWYKPFFSAVSDTRVGGVGFNISDMYCSADNNIFMTGYVDYLNYNSDIFPLDIYFNNEQSITIDHSENKVGYILKMNSTGNILWSRQSRGFNSDPNGGSVSTFETISVYEESNDIFVSGYAQQDTELYRNGGLIIGTILGDSDTIKGHFASSQGYSGIIANYDMDGNYKGVITPVTVGSYVSRACLYDNKIHALVKWDGGILQHEDSTYNYAIGTVGLSLCSWDVDGNALNLSTNITSSINLNMYPQELSINNRGEIVVAGNFDNTLGFGEHAISTGGAPRYMFIAKYGFPCAVQGESSGIFCYGDVYDGTTLTYSGDYTFIYESSISGIDSVHTLHATVHPQLLTDIRDTTVCTGDSFTLTADSGYSSYSWSSGSQTNTETLQFDQAGNYTIYVSITDGVCYGIDEIEVTAEICTDTKEILLPQISICPNPVTDICRIDIDGAKLSEITIIDIYGREILKPKSAEFSVAGLAEGIYIARVKFANDRVAYGKLKIN